MKATSLSLRLVIPIQGRWATVTEHGCTSSRLWSHCFDLSVFARALALAAQPALGILAELPALAEAQFPGEWQRCQRDLEPSQEVVSDRSLGDFRQWETAMLASLDPPPSLGTSLWRMWQRWRRPPAAPGSARPDAQAAHQRADLFEFLCSEDMRRLCEDGQRMGRLVG